MFGRKFVAPILTSLLCLFGAAAAQAQPAIDLVMCIDGSGSLTEQGFEDQLQGIADALECMPQDGTVRLSIIQFSNQSQLEWGPTIIDATNAASAADEIAHLNAPPPPPAPQVGIYMDSTTNTASCIDAAVDLLAGLADAADHQVIDISTDGLPNVGDDPIGAAQDAAANAIAAGVAQVNAIGIDPPGANTFDPTFLGDLIQPQNGDDGDGFCVPIDPVTGECGAATLAEYADALCEKVMRETTPPDDCAVYEAEVECTDVEDTYNVSLTVTNTSDNDAITWIWIDDDTLPPGVSVSQDSFDVVFLSGSPLCSIVNQPCSNHTITLDFTITVPGGMPGDVVAFTLDLHDFDFDFCCDIEVELVLPECEDCAKILWEKNKCHITYPFAHRWSYSVTWQNFFAASIDEIRLTPITPPGQYLFNDNDIDYDPAIPTGAIASFHTWIESIDPAGNPLSPGDEVCFKLSLHNDDQGFCCSIDHCITLGKCWLWPVPWPYEPVKMLRGEYWYTLYDFDRYGRGGAKVDTGKAKRVLVNWVDPGGRDGSSVTLTTTGVQGGLEGQRVGSVTIYNAGEKLELVPESASGFRRVEFYYAGRLVGAASVGELSASVAGGAWPTGSLFADGSLNLMWARAVPVSIAGIAEGVWVDEVVFVGDDSSAPDAITSVDIDVAGLESFSFNVGTQSVDDGDGGDSGGSNGGGIADAADANRR